MNNFSPTPRNFVEKQFSLIKQLNEIGHPDALRISREILEFTNDDGKIADIIRRLANDEPWEYIKGWGEFMGLRFELNSATLIPRIETEQLCQIFLEELPKILTELDKQSEMNIVDVCTGSGCIVISLAKCIREKFPKYNFKFYATDIDRNAIAMAKENCKNILGDRKAVNFLQTDLIESLPKLKNLFIVCNPPYIPTRVYEKLERSVRDYEPRIALDGGGDGLNVFKKLSKQIKNLYQSPILSLLETDPKTIHNLKALWQNASTTKLDIHTDYLGRERFLLATSI